MWLDRKVKIYKGDKGDWAFHLKVSIRTQSIGIMIKNIEMMARITIQKFTTNHAAIAGLSKR